MVKDSPSIAFPVSSQYSKKLNPTLSLCIIVKDEAEVLGRCLASIVGLVDEIIVVDSNSTDATIEIAQKYGAKIFQAELEDDFSKKRNVSLNHATCD